MLLHNSKKNGQKNIRCFPRCVPGGHRMAGFCGSNVLVSAKFPKPPAAPADGDEDSIVKIAEQQGAALEEEKSSSEPSTGKKQASESEDELPSLHNTIVMSEFLVANDPNKEGPGPVRIQIKLGSYYDSKPIMDLLKLAIRQSFSNPGERPCPQPFLARLEGGAEKARQADGSYIFNVQPKCWHYGWKSHKHANCTNHFLRVYAFQKVGNAFKCVAMDDSEFFTVSSSKRFRRDCNMTGREDISGAPIVKRMKGKSQTP